MSRQERRPRQPKTEITPTNLDPLLTENYWFGESLGNGAFGRVWKCLNKNTGTVVAVKEVSKANLNQKQLQSIMLELNLLRSLSHENIVQLIDFHDCSTHMYFILEFVEGGSLNGILKKFGLLSEPLVSLWMSQVLSALQYLHAKNIVHRDIKGANILINKDGMVKLTDFGSSTFEMKNKRMTVIGTPFWSTSSIILDIE
eukprot:TRINITY_DN1228_c0_g3_i1.p1 TRINITY_DN1228_c0_g3~~TRINITY_DN1228_c0_g3_i1.p1  ORF type:complete len:212 (-),score=41.08 TRINITY_DN1228_c0_g3_i1:539-1138(-)